MLLHKSVEFDSRVRREAGTLVQAGHEVCVLELADGATGTLDGFSRRSCLPPARLRVGRIFIAQNLRPAELVNSNRLHSFLPFTRP